jgi:hypothetical protein
MSVTPLRFMTFTMIGIFLMASCAYGGPDRERYKISPESLQLLTTETITDEMAVALVSGLEALIEVLKAM